MADLPRWLPLNGHGIPLAPAVEAPTWNAAYRLLKPRYGNQLGRVEGAMTYAFEQKRVQAILVQPSYEDLQRRGV